MAVCSVVYDNGLRNNKSIQNRIRQSPLIRFESIFTILNIVFTAVAQPGSPSVGFRPLTLGYFRILIPTYILPPPLLYITAFEYLLTIPAACCFSSERLFSKVIRLLKFGYAPLCTAGKPIGKFTSTFTWKEYQYN